MVCTVCIIDSNRLLSVCFKWEARISSCKYRANDGNIGNIKIELSEAALEKRKYRMPIKLCNAYLSDSVIQQRFFINDRSTQPKLEDQMKGVCIWLLVTLQSYKTGLTSRSLGLCSFADNYPDNRFSNVELGVQIQINFKCLQSEN